MIPDKCQCDKPGFCTVLNRKMSETRHRECQSKPGYFEMFLRESGGRHRGLGDTVADVLAWFGVKPKGGCGCERRRAWLNRIFPWG